jgi:predicted nucleotidyltransferase
MSDLPRIALEELPAEERDVAVALIQTLGDDLAALGWQGSYARGEAHDESDHDLFLVMKRLDSELLGKLADIFEGREGWSAFIKTEEELRQYPMSGRLQFHYGMSLVHGDFERPPIGRAEILNEIRSFAIDIEHECRYQLIHSARMPRDPAFAAHDAQRHARLLHYFAKMGLLAMKARELLDGRDYPLTREALRERIADEVELAVIDVVDLWPEFKPLYEADFVPLALLLDRFVRKLVSELPDE